MYIEMAIPTRSVKCNGLVPTEKYYLSSGSPDKTVRISRTKQLFYIIYEIMIDIIDEKVTLS